MVKYPSVLTIPFGLILRYVLLIFPKLFNTETPVLLIIIIISVVNNPLWSDTITKHTHTINRKVKLNSKSEIKNTENTSSFFLKA